MAEKRSLALRTDFLASGTSLTTPDLLRSFLEGRKETTFKTYRAALKVFAEFLDVESVELACHRLLTLPHGAANKVALDYRNWLIKKSYSAATINNRLAALRAVVDMGRTVGAIPWRLEVKSVREERYRDTAGPGEDKIIARIQGLAKENDPKSARDAAILSLLGLMGLRRGEVISLDLNDYEPGILRIIGKGHTDPEPLTVPPEIVKLLDRWLGFRGRAAGPLFWYFRGLALFPKRLSDRSVGRITNGLDLGHAHGLRHSAITQALDDHHGDLRKVARFSRHKNIQTLLRYDDNRQDLGGEVAQGLAKKLKSGDSD